MPEEWITGAIVPILKMGNPMECANYRVITLVNATYILTSIIMRRVKVYRNLDNISRIT